MKKIRMNRSIRVEGVFGVLKQDYGFRRFLMRGKKNIRIEFLLISVEYNVNKLYSKKVKIDYLKCYTNRRFHKIFKKSKYG